MNVCQVCGGVIHPLAGRCKHCKADLSRQRQAEAAARRGASATPIPQPVATAGSEPASRPGSELQPAPMMYHQPSSWARRWPLAVAAVALVAISISAGILIERARRGDKGDTESPQKGVQDATSSPQLNGPQGKQNAAPSPHASLGSSSAPQVEAFYGAVTSTVCKRLNSCGMLNDFSRQLCDELAKKTDPTAAARVRSGQCSYNKRAATACLSAIQQLKCDMTSSNVMDWVDSAAKLSECTSAFSCRTR